jgi:ribonucleoside-triphosphate reductase
VNIWGCRSFLAPWKDENGNVKFYGRFNEGVVTINLPDVALSSGGDEEKFWDIMEERLDLCYRALMIRHNRLSGTLSDVSPIHWQYGAIARLNKHEPITSLLYGGYSSISLGYGGLCECVRYMTGESNTSEKGSEFAKRVMRCLNEHCELWKSQTNIGFSVYGTPMESTTYKFAKCLKKRFGIVPGVTDRDYITNSYHVHVTEEIDAFSKLSFEAKFQELSLGGCISYVEVPDLQGNTEAVMVLMKYIYNNIMYAEINSKSDYCQVCGFSGEILIDDDMHWYCPNCGNRDQSKMNVTRRTCGYLGQHFWNEGKTEEIKERVLHL